jgi:hypothetical protein
VFKNKSKHHQQINSKNSPLISMEMLKSTLIAVVGDRDERRTRLESRARELGARLSSSVTSRVTHVLLVRSDDIDRVRIATATTTNVIVVEGEPVS